MSLAAVEIKVIPTAGDATQILNDAIRRAAAIADDEVVISLAPGNYHISREASTRVVYHISNTSSAKENPDQTKHIGLYFKDMHNVRLEGNGAWLITHGEMTPIVIDRCSNITLTGFTLTAADPTVPEVRIAAVDDSSITVDVTPPSRYDLADGDFCWVGEGWSFGHDRRRATLPEHAQLFDAGRNVTRRAPSPLIGRRRVEELAPGRLRFVYDKPPRVVVGQYYQLRHGIRNEACAFINRSSDVTLADVEFNFLGNFGLVGQYSENITYDGIRCQPRRESGRTDAGFADFVQMSGCRGKVRILNSYFEGSHDDPINIHGTHLKVVGSDSPCHLTVRFMHPQTYGFEAFFAGDSIELVNSHTLLPEFATRVKEARLIDDYTMTLTLEEQPTALTGTLIEDYVIENTTWTPEVEIRGNYFARTPTRGILLTTRRKAVVEGNTFFRIPMSAILVSDDARSWYESGPVHQLLIRRNEFIECASPVIAIKPETDRHAGAVHRNIAVDGNRFIYSGGLLLQAADAEGIVFSNNVVDVPADFSGSVDSMIEAGPNAEIDSSNNTIVNSNR